MLLLAWVYGYLLDPAFSPSGHIPWSETAGSYGHSSLNFFKDCHAVIHRDCTSLQSHCSVHGVQFLSVLMSIYFLFLSFDFFKEKPT